MLIGLGRDEGEAVTRGELEAELIRLAGEGELDKIRRILRARRDQVPREVVNEVVQEACAEVIDRQQAGGRITNVAGLIMTIAGRLLEKTWQRMVEGTEVDAAFARRQLEGGDWPHDDEWQAQIERATEYVFKVVVGWPADNLRRTLLTVIEAATEGMQLEPRDLAERLGCDRKTARVWRERAYDRLRVQLERDGISWEEVSGPLPGFNEDDEDLDTNDETDEEEM